MPESEYHELQIDLARMQEQMQNLATRIDEQKKLTESVQDMAISVKLLANSQKATEKKLDSLATDIDSLKSKPAQRWETVISAILSAIIAAFVAYYIK